MSFRRNRFVRKMVNKYNRMSFFKKNLVLVLACLLLTSIATIGYAALNQTLNISSELAIRSYKDVRITSLSLKTLSSGASEVNNSKFTKDTIYFSVVLPNSASAEYTATIKNNGTSSAILQDLSYSVNPSDQYFDIMYGSLRPGVTILDPGEEITVDFGIFRSSPVVASVAEATQVGCLIELTWIEYTNTSLLVANPPDLLNNSLVPVVYVEDNPNETAYDKMGQGNWVVADTSSTWYDYNSHKWANAVILASGVTKNVGDTVSKSEMLGMYVWIPRYSFTIKSEDGENYYGRTVGAVGATTATAGRPGAVDVKFVSASTTDTGTGYYTGAVATNWLTHPAFQWDLNNDGTISSNENLSGIWVGKFTTTGSATTPTVLPSAQVLTNQTAYQQFTTAQHFGTYLSNSTNTDAHMMKNSEWGAVAYLSQSLYGKYGNTDYTGGYKEIYMNNSLYRSSNNNVVITGYSQGMYNKTNSTGQIWPYYSTYTDINNSGMEVLAGVGASTTGTIYGVYDMAGGAYEHMMTYYTWGATAWGATSSGNVSGFSSEPALRYYDKLTSKYTNSISVIHAFQRWYTDNGVGSVVEPESPWVVRSGEKQAVDLNYGIYVYLGSVGGSGPTTSFRSVLIATS